MYKEVYIMENKINKKLTGIIISIYIMCSILVIYNLPTIFMNFIMWMGKDGMYISQTYLSYNVENIDFLVISIYKIYR